MNLLLQNLQDVNIPAAIQQDVLTAFNNHNDQYQVNTYLRIAHFMAQVCHESNAFRSLSENLNYSNPHRLMLTWPRRFPTLDIANQYISNPQKLGNFVYANRMGNGNPASGDGYKFRGRGPIQTTGKDNYTNISHRIFNDESLLDNPDQLTDISIGLQAAFIDWSDGNCNTLADADDIKSITKYINGGYNGLDSRKIWLADWKHSLSKNV